MVGNPANTNCLVALKNAPTIPKENFTALTMLDHLRSINQISNKLNVKTSNIKNATIWGNHSNTQVPILDFATINNYNNAKVSINDNKWVMEEFIPRVQKRGAEIIQAKGSSSVASAAMAIVRHIKEWHLGTEDGEFVSMGL